MSIESEARNRDGQSTLLQSVDLSGLPAPVADELRKLVATLRDNLGRASSANASAEEPDAWAERLQTWVNGHPARTITIDDSRESLYTGRGEY